jgi:hypothetical protein
MLKRRKMFLHPIFLVFFTSSKFKKDDLTQVGFVEDFMLFVVKGLLLRKIVESIWLQRVASLYNKRCPYMSSDFIGF